MIDHSSHDQNRELRLIRRANQQESQSRHFEPRTIGDFSIVRCLGRGGMGVVYLAEQRHPKRQVALKVMRQEIATEKNLRRFDFEVSILGRLEHPGIARIYEAGVIDCESQKTPYFAMELIEGRTLTSFLRKAELSHNQKLELIAQLCDAVHHAHQRGVIHRDIKPTNVLIAHNRQPKILDFGVARAVVQEIDTTTQLTESGNLIGTVPYFSPEQIDGDANSIDVRTDIYSLGVVGYVTLTGSHPYDLEGKSLSQSLQTIRNEYPKPMGAFDRTFSGDIESIFSRALDKDPRRRYQSSSEFADDIRRYLRNEPIEARPIGTLVRVGKFVRRNRGLSAGLVMVFVGILFLVSGVTVGLIRTEAARSEAEAVKEFFSGLLRGANPDNLGHTVSLREVLDQASTQIATEFTDRPLVQAELHQTIGSAYYQQSAFQEAEDHLVKALDIREAWLGDDDEDTAHAKWWLGRLYNTLARYKEAEELLLAAHASFASTFGDDHLKTINIVSALAGAYRGQGRYDEYRELVHEVFEARKQILPPDHEDIAQSLHNLGMLHGMKGEYSQAEPYFREAVAIYTKTLGPENHATLLARLNLSVGALRLGRLEEAEANFVDLLEIRTRLGGEDHYDSLVMMNWLATTYRDSGKYREAESLYRQSLEARRRTLGPEHPDTLSTMGNLANLLRRVGREIEAEPLYRDSLAIRRRIQGTEHRHTIIAMLSLGAICIDLDRLDEAEKILIEAIESATQSLGEDHQNTISGINWLANALRKQERFDESEILYQEAIEKHGRVVGTENPTMLAYKNNLAGLYLEWYKFADAERVLNEVIPIARRILPGDHDSLGEYLLHHGAAVLEQGRPENAEPALKEAFTILERKLGVSHKKTRRAIDYLVRLYDSLNQPEVSAAYRHRLG